jgi:hypothetical protein
VTTYLTHGYTCECPIQTPVTVTETVRETIYASGGESWNTKTKTKTEVPPPYPTTTKTHPHVGPTGTGYVLRPYSYYAA